MLCHVQVFIEAEDAPFQEAHWLMDQRTQQLLIDLLRSVSDRINNHRELEYLSFDLIWLQFEIDVPFLEFLRLGYHVVDIHDALDPLVRLLVKTHSNLCHCTLVFTDFRWDTYKDTELRW